VQPEPSHQVTDSSSEPGTLIGQFIVAYACDDRGRIAVLKVLLARSTSHHALNVIGAAVQEVVRLRWPDTYQSDDTADAVLQGRSIALRGDLVDTDVAELIVRLALGETIESSVGVRAQVANGLFVLWTFTKQLGMDRDAVSALVVRAEQTAISQGYSPTRADNAGG
jgi:hypothetical protein